MNQAIEGALRVHRFGERALHVQVWDQARVLVLVEALLDAIESGGIEDVTSGDGTLLIQFDGTAAGERRARRELQRADRRSHDVAWIADRPPPRRLVIPVRYGGADGPDLDEAADIAGCSPTEFVDVHVAREYAVRFIGFAPGFPYIGDLAPEIIVPRLAAPRTTTRAGSVAVAERYTGIYPADLPGGWRVIGWTPRRLFDPTADPPSHCRPGDLVRFEPI